VVQICHKDIGDWEAAERPSSQGMHAEMGQTRETLAMKQPVRKIALYLIMTCGVATRMATSQPPTLEWQRIFGEDSTDRAYSVQQTLDGGFIYAGETRSFSAQATDAILVRTGSMGIPDWHGLYGGSGFEVAYEVQEVSEGGFVSIGFTSSLGAGNTDAYLVRVNSQGDTLWTHTYGGPSIEVARSGRQTSDGGYILAGFSCPEFGDPECVYLVKTDNSGDTMWTRTYRGPSDLEIWSVRQTSNGGYILAGFTRFEISIGYDFFLMRTNGTGDSLWTRTYGGPNIEWGWAVRETEDGGFVMAGSTESYGAGESDIYVIRTDSVGDTIWSRTYGGGAGEEARALLITSDGGYVLAGSTTSLGAEDMDLFVVRANSAGDTLWTLVYGGEQMERAYSISPTEDGGYVLAGTIATFEPPYYYWDDCWLVKTGPDTSSTHAPSIEWVSHPKDFALHPAYPNPFNPVTTISFDVPFQSKISMNMYNVLGQRVAVLMDGNVTPGAHQVQWDASDSPSGIYFVSMNAGELVQLRKVVLLK